MGNVLVIAQIMDGEAKRSTNSAVTFAKAINGHVGGSYSILAIGDDLSKAKDALTKLGAEKVLLAQAPGLDNCVAEQWTPLIAEIVKSGGFEFVVSPASSTGKDVLPRVSNRLDAGMASDVTALEFEGGKLTYIRPMYAGNVNGKVQINTKIQVATLRQTEFDPFQPVDAASPVEVVQVPAADAAASRVEFLGYEKSVSERPDLSEAKVVIAGGRGLKSGDNFKIIEELADLLGGAVGATRAAVDAGFINNDFQVGQTGKIVAPELYIGVGLSGALQHVAGMKSSKTVVAINKDEEAPIFQVADYGLVADLFKAVPELTEEIKKQTK